MGQFYNQVDEQYGMIPYCDVFINVQWKRASIYVKYLNAFYKVWDHPEYFSAYHYIKPTPGFKFGIHWPFYVW